jgi:hypothetical protein
LESEFQNHVAPANQRLTDADPFHPRIAYLQGDALLGLEINNSPSCGDYKLRYFLDENGHVKQIIARKHYWTGDCGKFDSVFVMIPASSEVRAYTGGIVEVRLKEDEFIQPFIREFNTISEGINNWKAL